MTEAMFIRPVAVTPAMLTSNVTELTAGVDPAEWSGAATYAVGALASVAAQHMVYANKTGATGTSPATDTVNWRPAYKTNRHLMFDASVESQTQRADNITVTIAPGQYADAVAILNADCDSALVEVIGSSYAQTLQMTTRTVRNAYEYCFEPFISRQKAVFTDLPIASTAQIRVTLTKTGGTAKCGVCVIGLKKTIGGVKPGATSGINDFSRKDKDEFGQTTVVERGYSDRMNWTVLMDDSFVDEMKRTLTKYRAQPLVFVGVGNLYESLIAYGYYVSFENMIFGVPFSTCNLEIEGLL